MTLDMFVAMFKPPFAWREFLLQTWFVARVSLVPALTLSIPPLVVLTSFTFNTLLAEFGAADFSGTGAALGAVNQIGPPFVTVLVVAGAGASAICADLGSRTIREEVDAMRVLGLDPHPFPGCPPQGAGDDHGRGPAVICGDRDRPPRRFLFFRSTSST